jgi:putative ABC transport system permease protein
MGESIMLSMLGAALGLGLAALMLVGLSKSPFGQSFGDLSMSPLVALAGLGLALLLGFVTGFIPATSALRMRIVDAMTAR